MPTLAALLAVAAAPGNGWAQTDHGALTPAPEAPDLGVRRLPAIMPGNLFMRPRTPDAGRLALVATPGDDQDPSGPAPGDAPAAPDEPARPRVAPRRDQRARFDHRSRDAAVVFRVNIGVGLDGGQPSRDGVLLSGAPLDHRDIEYARLRIYSFGDAAIGSRGVLVPSLSTYLASRFRYDQDSGFNATAVPTVHDASGVEDLWIRSAYATWQGVGDIAWLAPLYVRAGRQYRYGPAVAHFDGLTVGYDARALSLGLFVGQAVDLTGVPLGSLYRERAVISGLDARLDLYRLARVPLSLTAETLRFDATNHTRAGLDVRLSRDISLRAGVRFLETQVARMSARLRAQVSKVTAVRVTVENRSRADWLYDIFVVEERNWAPLEFLHLGPSVPRWHLDARAGTVLLDNIDLLVFGGAALLATAEDEPRSAHTVAYAQAGGAIEVRLRRTIELGVSFMTRRYQREEPDQDDSDMDPGPLFLESDVAGERSFLEGGSKLRYTQGARRFSASAEGYVRYYRWQSPYGDPEAFDEPPAIDVDPDVRLGGRFTVEGWAGDHLRLKAEYDVSSALVVAPELSGVKSLRVFAEGRF